MDKFIAAYEKYGKELGPKDSYILLSYVGGLYGMEIAKRAIENGDITRAGLMKAVQSVDSFDAGGMLEPVATNKFPYETSGRCRVLAPDFENKSWKVVSGYAAPLTDAKPAAAAPTAAAEDEAAADEEEEESEEEDGEEE
jgi:hypothetical protein